MNCGKGKLRAGRGPGGGGGEDNSVFNWRKGPPNHFCTSVSQKHSKHLIKEISKINANDNR